jgi:transglutaminase-like putative cysteine protease
MFYSIRHSTRFRYSEPVRQSVMEVMMQPRSEGNQTVRQFELSTDPRARIFARRDFLGNIVHHFDIPGQHASLSVIAEALVQVDSPNPLPQSLEMSDWDGLDNMIQAGDYWDYLMPSKFSHSTPALQKFKSEIGLSREKSDPLTTVKNLNETMFAAFDYVPQFTRSDSPIDIALDARKGVCQDFSHIMSSLLRDIGIPTRYVSGYLFHRTDSHDRSVADATHAWIEAFLPRLGWVGFDPTNNLVSSERHIRTAIGRDYADVPPSKGVHRGKASGEIRVAVHVTPADAPKPEDLDSLGTAAWMQLPDSALNMADDMEEMSSQQQ